MIIRTEKDVTTAVLSELEGASDPRFREVMSAFVRHLHDFAREVNLTESEFQQALRTIVALGQSTNETHNEAVLMAGSLGFSMLVCLLNNGSREQVDTTANLLGPFWRMNAPRTENGGSIVRSPTPGEPLFVTARVVDGAGAPIAAAEVDVWHSSPEGFYEQQDTKQAEMNLRGTFVTDDEGRFGFRSVLPAGYPIPTDTGPVGALLRAQGRHNMRPAHIHFLIHKPSYKTLISQVYVNDDPYLDNDVQFGVTDMLVGDYVRHEAGEPAPEPEIGGVWYSLDKTFAMQPGEAKLPVPPIK